MSDNSTKRFQSAYIEQADAPLFMASHFRSSYHAAETVEFDVQRDDRDIAVMIQDHTGPRFSAPAPYTNREYAPPEFDEGFVINSYELLKRQPGQNPFEDVSFMGKAQTEFVKGIRRVENKLRRAVELQCSQVLQTGKVELRDATGTLLRTIDYLPKSSHLPGAEVDWDENSPKIYSDLAALNAVVRRDGKAGVGKYIFGESAFAALIKDETVLKLLDNRRMSLGDISPQAKNDSATYMGDLVIGSDRIECWTYQGSYKNPADGVDTPFVSPWKVVAIGKNADLELSFGAIPQLVGPDPRLSSIALGRIQGAGGLDLSTNIWLNDRGTVLKGSAGTRPLAIAKAIDAFACLNTKVS